MDCEVASLNISKAALFYCGIKFGSLRLKCAIKCNSNKLLEAKENFSLPPTTSPDSSLPSSVNCLLSDSPRIPLRERDGWALGKTVFKKAFGKLT